MEESVKVCDAGQLAPQSGATAGVAPLLDKECRYVPTGSERPSWTRKQWKTRRAVLDRLRYWQSSGYQCLWVTLTSAPDSPDKRLRADFHVLRKRAGRELGFSAFEYVCVDTREGHGVLHMLWAWKDPNPRKRASFYIPFDWLQAQWNEVHGAFHVNIKRIGGSDKDARRLSRYIVAQYCGGQNALVRLSQSKLDIPLNRMRSELLRFVKERPEPYEWLASSSGGLTMQQLDGVLRSLRWQTYRRAWDSLVSSRSCSVYGIQFVWWGGELRQV